LASASQETFGHARRGNRLELYGEVPIDMHVSDGDFFRNCASGGDHSLGNRGEQLVSREVAMVWHEPAAAPRALGSLYGSSSSRSSRHGWTASIPKPPTRFGWCRQIGVEPAVNGITLPACLDQPLAPREHHRARTPAL
jgi:hypothetical protein